MTRIQPFFLGFVLLSGCGELSRTPGADAGGTVSPRTVCSRCHPTFERCDNGECLQACERGETLPCGDDSRCLGAACRPPVEPTCEERPCNVDQSCASTYCVATTERTCVDHAGCGPGEFCVDGRGTCAIAPFCNADDRCHTGTRGAVCNVRGVNATLPDPSRLEGACLIGRCASNAHCPATLTCLDIGAEQAGLGVCR